MSHIGDDQLLICVALLCDSTFILAGMCMFRNFQSDTTWEWNGI